MTLRLEPIASGNDAGQTIVFIQGWPDSASLWDEAVAALGSTYRCVRVTMPNFDGQRSVRWGYTTDEIVDALTELVREAAKNGPVTLVLHDWGAYWGYPVHHRVPELVSRVVGVDIGAHFKPGLGGALGITAYQSWLFGAFLLGGSVGDWMTRSFAKVGHVPDAHTRALTAWMNYPYRNSWADLFTGRMEKLTKGYWPTCPLLFVYGEKKPFPFHGENWVEHVKKVGGKVVGLPSDHWVMRDPSFVSVLVRWLEATR
jgi:pimeloyl-ACP methyl ester carboxylesterase